MSYDQHFKIIIIIEPLHHVKIQYQNIGSGALPGKYCEYNKSDAYFGSG